MLTLPLPDQPIYKKIDNYVFNFNELLGQGNFSKVYKGRNQVTNETVAIKVVELNSLKSKKLKELLISEIDILKKLNHPNVLKCFEVFTSNRNCYIITEICNGGDLQAKLKKQQQSFSGFPESQAQPYIFDIFKGLRYLAQNHVVHRDIKMANIFMHNGIAKIADFGFAKCTNNNFNDINIGSPIYMSPQGFINNIYGPKTDVWAFGIFMYELLHGKTPFSHCLSETDLRKEIISPILYSSMKAQLSFQLKDVITKCLQINEDKRITVAELEETPYFKRLLKYDSIHLNGHKKQHNLLNPPIQHNINSFSTISKALSPNPINSNNGVNGNPISKRALTDTLGYSLQKGRANVKSFYNSFDIQSNNNHQHYIKDLHSTEPNKGNKKVIPHITTHSDHKRINDLRSHSLEKDTVTNSKNFLVRDIKVNNTSFTTSPNTSVSAQNSNSNSIFPSSINSEIIKPKIQVNYLPPQKRSDQNILLPGILSFKQAVNCLHYCRLFYKCIMLNREVEENDRMFMASLAALMFKVLNEISNKIDKKEIAYDEETNKKQNKLREVSSEYYRKYSDDIERPFNRQVSYDTILYQVKNKIKQFETLYFKTSSNTYLLLLHFFLVIIEATEMLKKCTKEMKFWEWSQFKYVEEFLSKSKNSANYQSYLTLRMKVMRY